MLSQVCNNSMSLKSTVEPMDKMQSLEASSYSSPELSESADNHDDMSSGPSRSADFTLLDTIERILDKGLVINGDISIDVAGAELLSLRINLVIASLETAKRYGIQLPWENWNNQEIKNQPIENRNDSNIGGIFEEHSQDYNPSGNFFTKSYNRANVVNERSGRAQEGNGNNSVHNKSRRKKKSTVKTVYPRSAAYGQLRK
jgi:gas vesicle protein GvpA/GvpJ/GvpM family